MTDRVTFYHNPMSRGRIVHWMLEEAGAPYDMKIVSLEKNEQKAPEFLAINPMGKLPAIVHRGTVVTLAPSTVTRNTGNSAWIISDETSMQRLTKPSAHTPRGMRASVADGCGRAVIRGGLHSGGACR